MARAIALLLISAALTAYAWDIYSVGQYNDDVTYIALARSLAQGHPYLDLSIVNAAIPTRFPPLYPVLIAPLQWLAPHNYLILRLLSAALSSAALYLTYKYSRSLWPCALLAVNTLWLAHSSSVMSEPLFTVALLAYLMRLEKISNYLALGIYAALCYYIRAAALVLVPLTLLHAPNNKQRLNFLFGFLILAGPHAIPSILTGYGGEISQGPDLAANFLTNLDYFPRALGATLLGHPDMRLDILQYATLASAAYGLWKTRKTSAAGACTLFTLALLMVWPYQMVRLAWPILPLLFIGLTQALPRRALPVLLALNLFFLFHTHDHYRQPTLPDPVAHNLSLKDTVMADRSWIYLSTGQPVLPALPDQAFSNEPAWLERLWENRIGSLLIPSRQYHAPTFESLQKRPQLYSLIARSNDNLVFAFHPPDGWRKAFRLQLAARQALAQKRLDRAEAILKRALPLAPWDISLNCALARTWLQQGRLEQADQLAQALLKANPACQEAIEVRHRANAP